MQASHSSKTKIQDKKIKKFQDNIHNVTLTTKIVFTDFFGTYNIFM